MKRIKAERIAKFSGGKLIGPKDTIAESVEIDSRKAAGGSMFIGLKGENSDGNDYAGAAYDNGCRIFMLSSEEKAGELTGAHADASVILVEDTLAGMQLFAKNLIEDAEVYRIAITGSTGKTTTKEMLKCLLDTRYSTICNYENFNNHIGVPLTAFQLENDTEVAIFEMGMNHSGEIKVLADIVKPETAIITNVGLSHIGNLGSREAIMDAKMEVTSFMEDEEYLLIYNTDNDMLRELNGEDTDFDKVRVGEKAGKHGANITDIEDLGEEGINFTLNFRNESVHFHIPVPGRHNAWNAALAVICAFRYGVGLRQSVQALRNFRMAGNRLNIQESAAGIKVINDAYNASPDSVRSGLDVLMSAKGERKIAVLGDMLELGDEEEDFHRSIGKYAAEKEVDLLITVGEISENTAAAAAKKLGEDRIMSFADAQAFIDASAGIFKPGDTVLVKGSHSMGLERAAEYILNQGV